MKGNEKVSIRDQVLICIKKSKEGDWYNPFSWVWCVVLKRMDGDTVLEKDLGICLRCCYSLEHEVLAEGKVKVSRVPVPNISSLRVDV